MRVKFSWLVCAICFVVLFSHTATANLQIIVQPDKGWGPALTSNIKAVCENVALHFQEQLRDEHRVKNIKIIVDHGGPHVVHKSSEPTTYYISLSVSDTYWQQFAYQFAHEFCHVLHKIEKFKNRHPNTWFYESICMSASIWALNEMSKTWEYRPPYPNWANWRANLALYAYQNKDRHAAHYDGTASEWIKKWEDFLRDDANNTFTHHLLVSQLSYKFILPIFEQNPEAWNAIAQMPTHTGKMQEYMKCHRLFGPQFRKFNPSFVARIP